MITNRPLRLCLPGLCLAFFALFVGLRPTPVAAAAPFTIQGPGVNLSDFRITVFATNLNYPLGMARLSDGSLMVAISKGTSFGNSIGQIIRLTDTNLNGVADGPGTVLYTGLPGGQSSLRMSGNLVFVTGQGSGKPISVLRAGATPSAALTSVGAITLTYPSGNWLHPHSALGVRPTPGKVGSCDLFFQLGSDQNFSNTTRTVTMSSALIAGASGTLQGESIYMLTLTDNGTSVVATNLIRVAKGLRNAAGFAFHPLTSDFYFAENGIDGLVNANEPFSADELNWIPTARVGNGTVPDFGFPSSYTAYRIGTVVGGGVQPLVTFEPLPDPFTGSESEGPNDIAFAPAGFPDGLNNGIFVGFHGKYSLAGIANEENPLVFVNLNTTNYFQIIGNNEPNIGHLDGLLSTSDSLFAADLASTGFGSVSGTNTGVIYQLKSLVTRLRFYSSNNTLELTWPAGVLQQATSLSGPWNDIPSAVSPYSVGLNFNETQVFYRTRN